MTALNDAYLVVFTHHLVRLGLKKEAAEQISQMLVRGLWNNAQDFLLTVLVKLAQAQGPESGTAGFDVHVAKIRNTTDRAHATVFYHSLLKLGWKEKDAAWFARYFARSFTGYNCDKLKVLLLEGGAQRTLKI